MPVNRLSLMLVAGGQEDQENVLIRFTDFRGGFNAGHPVHENIQEDDGKTAGGTGLQQRFTAGEKMEVKMKPVPGGVFIQCIRELFQGIRPVVCQRDVHSSISPFLLDTENSITLVPVFCHSSQLPCTERLVSIQYPAE